MVSNRYGKKYIQRLSFSWIYNQGKTFNNFITEIKNNEGTLFMYNFVNKLIDK